MTKHAVIVGQEAERPHLDVNGRRVWREPMRFGSIDGKHTLLMMPGRGKFSKIIQGRAHGTMTEQHCTRVMLFLGESQQILCALPCSNVLASREVKSALPAEHGHQSGGVAKLGAQCVGASIRSSG